MYLTLKNINFPFETNGKLMILGVPIFKHFKDTIQVIWKQEPCKRGTYMYNTFIFTINTLKFSGLWKYKYSRNEFHFSDVIEV